MHSCAVVLKLIFCVQLSNIRDAKPDFKRKAGASRAGRTAGDLELEGGQSVADVNVGNHIGHVLSEFTPAGESRSDLVAELRGKLIVQLEVAGPVKVLRGGMRQGRSNVYCKI